ncbi:Uncharacterized conserved protein YlxW, UPF0749 family [Tessaracoccus bendigoensis DSM 12906]|uniref:Uncharacterized conserved protein YlxW, UPF0749 family n=1 Tax=Tessaracoccus bendigoensis DSM 12906 TaxID=1123357 RepID=A0A1M6KJ25_9ACTN|nr:DUF881 domain-containing protein [Tessaracoccus bendigoensis]SHJ58953.1 Uncharacterized conserved protein YlxW, UPF0749 family [Tessaracoccus bendigoensis DSM 12906]
MPDQTPLTPPEPESSNPGRARRAAAPRRNLLKDFFRPNRGQFSIGIALLLTALLVVTTIRSQNAQPEFSNVRQADLIQLLDNVTAETRRLEDQVGELEQARTELVSGADRDQAAREEAQRRLVQAEILAGTVPAVGPGVRIEILDPEGRVTAELLLDAIEELRDAGAEVIELNDSVRLVMRSHFLMDEQGNVTADGTVLNAPYIIDAIGDPATLEAGARFRGGLVSEVEGDRVEGSVTITQLTQVDISTVVTPPTNQFARPR